MENATNHKPYSIALTIENFSRQGGGAESYAIGLAEMLVAHGWDVHLFGYAWDGHPEKAIFHRIKPLPKWAPSFLRILHFAMRHRKMVRAHPFNVIVGFGATLQMNVYQSHGGVHHLSSERKIFALKSAIFRQAKRLGQALSPKYHARSWIEGAAFRLNPRPTIVAISDMVREDMASTFGISKDRIMLVYNGIDPLTFASAQGDPHLRRQLGFAANQRLFLFMGYDFRKKGVQQLVEASALLKKKHGKDTFGVVIVGGKLSGGLAALMKREGLEDVVKFPGPTKNPQEYYAACDVFVLPTFYDACSLVIFEAMTAGLPCITTKWNGAAGIIEHGVDGITLDDPQDVGTLAQAMSRFLDASYLQTLSVAARVKARQYTVGANHEHMLAILTEVAEKGYEQ